MDGWEGGFFCSETVTKQMKKLSKNTDPSPRQWTKWLSKHSEKNTCQSKET